MARISVWVNGKNFEASSIRGKNRSTSADEDTTMTQAEFDELKDLFDTLEDFVVE